MSNKFDELTKDLARSVTRRAALKKFGVGLVAAMAASLGIRTPAAALKRHGYCAIDADFGTIATYTGQCVDPVTCQYGTGSCNGKVRNAQERVACGFRLDVGKSCTF